MNDLLCVYIKELKTAIFTMYRPPDFTRQSFSWRIRKVNAWIRKIQQKVIPVNQVGLANAVEGWEARTIE